MKTRYFIPIWLLLCTAAFFIAAWVGYAEFMRQEFIRLFQEAELRGWQVSGQAVAVRGFPKAHTITWGGQMRRKEALVRIPHVTLQGWPIPNQHLTLEMSQGFEVVEDSVRILKADLFRLQLQVPPAPPLTLDDSGMRAWQERDGRLPITDLRLHADGQEITGTGYLSVDAALQPSGRLNLAFSNPDALLESIKLRAGTGMAFTLASGLINATRKTAPDGHDYVPIPVTIKNSTVYVGMLRVTKLKPVQWGAQDTPPADLQLRRQTLQTLPAAP